MSEVVEVARELTGARHAALGVLDEDRHELELFTHVGTDEETRARIAGLSQGGGVSELIRNPAPLRLREVGEHPRSHGFPPGHPPMHSFLSVPIVVRGQAYGNIYLAEKEGGDFDASRRGSHDNPRRMGGGGDLQHPPLQPVRGGAGRSGAGHARARGDDRDRPRGRWRDRTGTGPGDDREADAGAGRRPLVVGPLA